MGGKQIILPFFLSMELHIPSKTDNFTLVKHACEVHKSFLSSVTISSFKFTNVAILLHIIEPYNDFGAEPMKKLMFTFLQHHWFSWSISQDIHFKKEISKRLNPGPYSCWANAQPLK